MVDLTLPEQQPTGLDVRMEGKTLHISSGQTTGGVTQEESNSSTSAGFGSYTSSNFSQSLSLPGPVKTDQVSMNYKDGRFEITLPKG